LTFLLEFHAALAVLLQRNASSIIVPITKAHLFRRHFVPFWPRAPKIFNTWDRFPPTCACKILSGSVKVCRSYSRKADFEQIHITQSCIFMAAYNNLQTRGLSKHHIYLWFCIFDL